MSESGVDGTRPVRDRWRRIVATIVLTVGVTAAACTPPPADCAGFTPAQLPEFMFGSAATDVSTEAMDAAAAIGYRWVRVPIRWVHLQPTVTSRPALTRAELAARPELVDQFAATADWSLPDRVLAHAEGLGLRVVGYVGASSPPTLDGRPLDPGALGTESYLANQELVARAIVRRYGPQRVGAPAGAPTITVWQTENELNIAPAATLVGWRSPSGFDGFLNSPWADFRFQTELLTALRRGVRAEDPTAVTIVNINTDMADSFNTTFGRPGWEGAVSQWRTLADVVALDTYPNYFLPGPVDGTIVGQRVARIRELACPAQQVVVMETGYPNGPVARGYSAEAQAEFLAEAWASSRDAGASGFMPFGIVDGGDGEPAFTPRDLVNLDQLGVGLRAGDLGTLANLFLGDPEWVATRLSDLTQVVEGNWGVVRPDGTPLPAGLVVQGIAAETGG